MTEERAGLPSTQPMCLLRIRKKEKTRQVDGDEERGARIANGPATSFRRKSE